MNIADDMPVPQLVMVPARLVAGLHQTMNLLNDTTPALWQRFGPLVKTMAHRANNQRISMTVYPPAYSFVHFDPRATFTKWAAVEVTQPLPPFAKGTLEHYTIPAGLYARFTHHGPAHRFPAILGYLLSVWLPAAGLEPDERPFFEILGPEYHPSDPNAREEVFIPVRTATPIS